MADALAQGSAAAAFLVNLVLAAWCLIRGARSVPTVLMSLLLVCLAVWNGFEFLWMRHRVPTYEQLGFFGVSLAPCFAFHYSQSLVRPSRLRGWMVTGVYCGTTFFVLMNLGAFIYDSMREYYASPASNAAFLAFFTPVGTWTLASLWWSRRKATEPAVRSLFTYPLLAGLIMIPFGFLELASKLHEGLPRLASLGGFAGGVILAVGVFRHRIIYDALALLRRDAAGVLRATVHGILLVDPDGRIVFMNSVAKNLLGGEMKSLAETGLPLPADEGTVVRRNDRILELRAVRSLDVFPPGRVSLILQDRTREYERMQALASSEALNSLGQAAATLAHEIRNPLTTIQSAAECVKLDAEAGRAPERRHLEMLAAETRRLNELLERSLQLGRPLQVRPENCDLNALLRETLRRVPAPGAKISESLADNLPPCRADPDLLLQLFINLVRNALEASREVVVATRNEGDATAVRVFSGGARIAPEIESRLFQPFVSSKPGGSGLGLAFCRKIATAHGADLEGGNVDGGVEFTVRFAR